MRVHRLRMTASLAAVLAVSLAGCSSRSPGSSGGSSAAAASSAPAVTQAAASAAFGNYERVNNTANGQFDGNLETTVETAPQITIDQAGYTIQQRERQQPFKPFTYQNPVFYIPSLAGSWPRWFAVDAGTGSGQNASRQLMLFRQESPGAPWKLAEATMAADDNTQLPLPVNATSSATSVPPGQPGLAVTPGQLPSRLARLLTSQTMDPAFAPGPLTTGALSNVESFRKTFASAGWRYQNANTPGNYPVYALRSSDGGAVVWFSINERQSAVRTGPARPVSPRSVVGDVTSLVSVLSGHSQIAQQFTIDAIGEYVAIVPPQGHGKVSILGVDSGYVSAIAS